MRRGIFSVLVLVCTLSVSVGLQAVSIDELKDRAKEGDAAAQLNLGMMYSRGLGVSADKTLALAWLRLAAKQGNAEAKAELDRISVKEEQTVTKTDPDTKKAIEEAEDKYLSELTRLIPDWRTIVNEKGYREFLASPIDRSGGRTVYDLAYERLEQLDAAGMAWFFNTYKARQTNKENDDVDLLKATPPNFAKQLGFPVDNDGNPDTKAMKARELAIYQQTKANLEANNAIGTDPEEKARHGALEAAVVEAAIADLKDPTRNLAGYLAALGIDMRDVMANPDKYPVDIVRQLVNEFPTAKKNRDDASLATIKAYHDRAAEIQKARNLAALEAFNRTSQGITTAQETADAITVRAQDATWETVSIPGICTYQIPPTVEIQKGTYKRINDQFRKTILEIDSSLDRAVAQPKGVNDLDSAALSRYCRVIVETERGSRGDYSALDVPLPLSATELKELDEGLKNQMQQAVIASASKGTKMTILSWQPAKVVRVNGVDAILTTITRSVNDGPPVLARMYAIQNNDVMHRVTISFRESESALWADDLGKVIDTFKFRKR